MIASTNDLAKRALTALAPEVLVKMLMQRTLLLFRIQREMNFGTILNDRPASPRHLPGVYETLPDGRHY